MTTKRKTPPVAHDYLAFALALARLAHITHIPRPLATTRTEHGVTRPLVRWSKIRVSPLVSVTLAKRRPSRLPSSQRRLYRGIMLDSPLGGEIHASYSLARAIGLGMRYNNRSDHWSHTGPDEWTRKGRNPMAKVILPALSAQASGKIGDVVFMRRAGQNIARLRVKPSNPNSPAQQLTRGNLAALATAWRLADQTGSVTLTRAPSTPQSFAYLTLAEKASWSNFQTYIGTNIRLLAAGSPAVRTGS